MSFLQGILSSIGDGKGVTPSTRPSNSALSRSNEAPARLATGTNGVNPIPVRLEKRKAEDMAQPPPSKMPRIDDRPVEKSTINAGQKALEARYRAPANVLPQRINPNQSSFNANNEKTITNQPNAKVQNSNLKSKPVVKPIPAAAPNPAPAKGSYAQILARAKAEQEAKQPVGSIKHKKIEKIPKKEKEKLAKEVDEQARVKAAAAAREKKMSYNGVPRPGHLSVVKKMELPAEKPKKKAVDLGYSGTMRSSEPGPSYKSAMGQRPLQSPRKIGGGSLNRSQSYNRSNEPSGSGGKGKKIRMAGYASYSEDDLDDEEDDYGSDASSDMEAGAYDIDEEEERSLRVAVKEDTEAKKQEDEHKRQKELRKNMLAKMAADAEKRRKRF